MQTELDQIYSSYTTDIAMSTAIGHEVINLLKLKENKKTGYVNTSWGTKSKKGLGECIQRIVEEQTNRAKNQALLKVNDDNYSMGLLSTDEYNKIKDTLK